MLAFGLLKNKYQSFLRTLSLLLSFFFYFPTTLYYNVWLYKVKVINDGDVFLYYIDITFLAYALYNIQILKQKHFLHQFTQIGFPALYTVCRVF